MSPIFKLSKTISLYSTLSFFMSSSVGPFESTSINLSSSNSLFFYYDYLKMHTSCLFEDTKSFFFTSFVFLINDNFLTTFTCPLRIIYIKSGFVLVAIIVCPVLYLLLSVEIANLIRFSFVAFWKIGHIFIKSI